MLNMCPNIDIAVPTVTILMQPQQLSCGQGIMGWRGGLRMQESQNLANGVHQLTSSTSKLKHYEIMPMQYTENMSMQYTEIMPMQYTENMPMQYTENMPMQYTQNMPMQYTQNMPMQYTEIVLVVKTLKFH